MWLRLLSSSCLRKTEKMTPFCKLKFAKWGFCCKNSRADGRICREGRTKKHDRITLNPPCYSAASLKGKAYMSYRAREKHIIRANIAEPLRAFCALWGFRVVYYADFQKYLMFAPICHPERWVLKTKPRSFIEGSPFFEPLSI